MLVHCFVLTFSIIKTKNWGTFLELFKRCSKFSSLQRKKMGVGFQVFVGDIKSEVGFRPLFLRLPGPGPQPLDGIFRLEFFIRN